MEPKSLLDTDVLSGLMRKTPAALNRARTYLADHRQLTISLVTRFEILRGLKANRATAQLAAFDSFCLSNEVLPMTDRVIVRAADIYADRAFPSAADDSCGGCPCRVYAPPSDSNPSTTATAKTNAAYSLSAPSRTTWFDWKARLPGLLKSQPPG